MCAIDFPHKVTPREVISKEKKLKKLEQVPLVPATYTAMMTHFSSWGRKQPQTTRNDKKSFNGWGLNGLANPSNIETFDYWSHFSPSFNSIPIFQEKSNGEIVLTRFRDAKLEWKSGEFFGLRYDFWQDYHF